MVSYEGKRDVIKWCVWCRKKVCVMMSKKRVWWCHKVCMIISQEGVWWYHKMMYDDIKEGVWWCHKMVHGAVTKNVNDIYRTLCILETVTQAIV